MPLAASPELLLDGVASRHLVCNGAHSAHVVGRTDELGVKCALWPKVAHCSAAPPKTVIQVSRYASCFSMLEKNFWACLQRTTLQAPLPGRAKLRPSQAVADTGRPCLSSRHTCRCPGESLTQSEIQKSSPTIQQAGAHLHPVLGSLSQ